MKARLVFCLAIVLAATAPLAAQNKNAPKQNAPRNPILAAAFGEDYVQAKLTPPQEQKLVVLIQKYAAKMAEAEKKLMDVYTKEQQATLKQARELAIRAKVKPQNIEKRVKDAEDTFELTAEQKTARDAAKAELAALKAEITAAAGEFLEPAQIKELFGDAAAKKKKK